MDNEMVEEFLRLRALRDQTERDYQEAAARLAKQMEADQRKNYRWSADGVTHQITYKQSRTTVIDEPGLRRALTAKVFDRYTKRVLDRKAMESAMDAGQVDPVTVSRFVTIKPSKPYLEYREKDAE